MLQLKQVREFFLRSFSEGVGAVMCAYNRINNTYACENNQTLTNDLKEYMRFEVLHNFDFLLTLSKGWVMSDWGATHSTVNAANAGLGNALIIRDSL